MARLLDTTQEDVYEAVEGLLNELLGKNKLRSYGMLEEEKISFTDSVIEGQGRLLANNYVPLTRADILSVYTNLY